MAPRRAHGADMCCADRVIRPVSGFCRGLGIHLAPRGRPLPPQMPMLGQPPMLTDFGYAALGASEPLDLRQQQPGLFRFGTLWAASARPGRGCKILRDVQGANAELCGVEAKLLPQRRLPLITRCRGILRRAGFRTGEVVSRWKIRRPAARTQSTGDQVNAGSSSPVLPKDRMRAGGRQHAAIHGPDGGGGIFAKRPRLCRFACRTKRLR